MREVREVCGTCKHCDFDGQDYFCANAKSENYTEYTLYDSGCDEWEGR